MHLKTQVLIGLLYLLNQNIWFIFDSFGIEHIPKEINKFVGKNDTTKSSAIARIKCLEYKHMIQLCVDIFV